MRFYTDENKPYRIYLEDTPENTSTLYAALSAKFYVESPYDKEDAVENIIFLDELVDKYYFYKGLYSIVLGEATKLGFSIEDCVPGSKSPDAFSCDDPVTISPELLEGIVLRDYQVGAIEASLNYKQGLIHAPTGSGKSEMLIGITKHLHQSRDFNIMICVPTTNLLHQTAARMVSRGLSNDDFSIYGDGNVIDTTKRIAIATVQTAFRRLTTSDQTVQEWYGNLGCLIMDEAHHSHCRTWSTLIDTVSPEYMLGFSAEPFHADKDHLVSDLILRGIVGPVIHRTPISHLIEKGYLSKPYVIALDSTYPGNIYTIIDWHTVNKLGIITNTARNNLIVETAAALVSIKKNPLILVQQINHGVALAEELSKKVDKVVFLTGGLTATVYVNGSEVDKFKDSNREVNAQFERGEIDVLLGTSTMDEGVDLPSLSSVILAAGSRSRLKLIQRIGRGLRSKVGDNTTVIIDFRDRFNVVLHKHHRLRKDSFQDLGFPLYYSKDLSSTLEIIDRQTSR